MQGTVQCEQLATQRALDMEPGRMSREKVVPGHGQADVHPEPLQPLSFSCPGWAKGGQGEESEVQATCDIPSNAGNRLYNEHDVELERMMRGKGPSGPGASGCQPPNPQYCHITIYTP